MQVRTLGGSLASAVLALSAVLTAQATPEQIDKILAQSGEKSQVTAFLDHLVNRIGPRLTSSCNLQIACEWARDELRDMGIDNARLEQWGEFPVGFNRGPWFGRVVEPEEFALEFNTAAWSAGTRGRARGPVRKCPRNPDEIASLSPEQIAGSWFLDPPRSRAVRDALADAGALGFLVGGRDLLITSGSQRVDFDDLPRLPMARIRADHYRRLRKLMEGDKPVVVELDIRNHFKRGPIPLYDVIAEIRGTEFPAQYVIVGGHIDSWDGATGTTDNGTGVATTLEAARLLTSIGARPRRTIRFMLWSGEEQGLLGSRAYISKHPEENDKVSAVLVHDGGTNYVAGIAGLPAMIPTLQRVFAPVEKLDPEMPFKVHEIKSFAPIGSDHDSYCARGVPGFFWRQAGRANYTHTHHTQYDTFDAAIEEYQIHSSQVIAIGALGLANEDTMLTREGFKYRSFRGRTRRGPNRILGVALGDTTEIDSVVPGSPAAKAGVRAGDVIVKVGDQAIEQPGDISRALRTVPKKTSVTVRRGQQTVVLSVEFAE